MPFDWTGQTAFILGGGPSVLDLDLSPLTGRRVIAINSAYETWPQADICFFADARWYFDVYPKQPKFMGQFATTSTGGPRDVLRFTKIDPANGIATKRDQLALSRTSVSGAANLARHWGAKAIVLLGVDGKIGGAKRHHHSAQYPWPLVNGCFDQHRNELAGLSASLRAEGIRLMNCSPVNIIPGWDRASFAEALS
jgi:hypothetical protein